MIKEGLFKLGTAAAVLLLIALSGCSSSEPEAEAGIEAQTSGNGMECLYTSDFYMVHFTAYQNPEVKKPGINYFRPFCQKLPDVGPTFVTIDLMDKDVREMPVAMKFVEIDTEKSSGKTLVVKKVISEGAQEISALGVFETNVAFDKPGHYALYVLIGEEIFSDDDIVKIPFEVGAELETQ
ncbi:MAG: hypothetical protein DRQ61_12315 [Gammaproteobacteria bacterium]|nr:MAG: hypothetical protein DRQ56_07955 [Gammaproteobacteria bacterium]RLA18876.1 MAG: hypothetical protein DRQ61_12315 [Gammaproteobacteria bacterium]